MFGHRRLPRDRSHRNIVDGVTALVLNAVLPEEVEFVGKGQIGEPVAGEDIEDPVDD